MRRSTLPSRDEVVIESSSSSSSSNPGMVGNFRIGSSRKITNRFGRAATEMKICLRYYNYHVQCRTRLISITQTPSGGSHFDPLTTAWEITLPQDMVERLIGSQGDYKKVNKDTLFIR